MIEPFVDAVLTELAPLKPFLLGSFITFFIFRKLTTFSKPKGYVIHEFKSHVKIKDLPSKI